MGRNQRQEKQTCLQNKQDKLIWVDKIETVLPIIATSFDGTIVLTTDTDINVKENT